MKTLLLTICIPLLFSNLLPAQNGTEKTVIRGRITDKKDRTAIIGASVMELDKDRRTVAGVTTDLEGNFALKVADLKNRIGVSFIGYKTIVQPINGRTVINIQLESNANELGEVEIKADKMVSTGMLNIAERNSTLAIARINAEEVQDMQASSIDQALQGRLPGVDIIANSGDPGAGMSIRIRGTSSINGSTDPLVVVDGMPYETSIPSDFNFGTADETSYAQLLNIAPSDIKDISILKDAAATAMWGSRAANGVLVINTKRGAVGKPAIAYTFKGSLAKMQTPIPMLNGNQYSMLIPEEFMNRNGTPLNTQTAKEFQYDPNDPYWYWNYSNNTNWIDAITQTGYVMDHNISITGGGEKARYFSSLGYMNQRGVTKGTGLSRINARINLDFNVSNRLRFRTDLTYTHLDNHRNYVNAKDSEDRIREVAYRKMPNMGIYEHDEYGNLTPNFFSSAQNIQGQYGKTYNPLAMALLGKNRIVRERIVPHFNLQYDIIPERLFSTFDVQFDINNDKNNTFLPQSATGRPWTETVVNRTYDGDIDVFNVQTKSSLVYTPRLNEKHKLMALLTIMSYDNKSVLHEVMTSNTASDALQDPAAPSRTKNEELGLASGQYQTRSISGLISAQYGLLDRYMINVGLRGDGHSRFGPAHRYGLFPSISARWRISGEKFMQRFKFLSELSLRASYGESGNAPRNDYTYFNLYDNFDWSYLGQSGVYPQNMELTNLKWETVAGRNLGLNLGLFQNRLTLDVEVYKNRTRDMFYNGLQISSFTGFDKVNMNVGTMDNQGWEIGLNITAIRNKSWVVDFNFNMAHNENIIREISEYYPREKGNITANGQYKTMMQENNPFGSFYGFRYKGVYKDDAATIAKDKQGKSIIGPDGQAVRMRFNYPAADYIFQAGDAMYEDINHDGNINYMDVVYLGNGNPRFTGGFGPTITFRKNLKLNAFFSFRYDYDLVNGTKMNTTNMYGYDNQSTAVLRRWRKPGDETDIPRALYGAGYNWLGSDRYVENASFLRLRAVTLSYNVASKWLTRLHLKGLRTYFTAENIYTFTRYTGQDPEVSTRGNDPFRVAIDYSMTPPPKSYTLGLSANF